MNLICCLEFSCDINNLCSLLPVPLHPVPVNFTQIWDLELADSPDNFPGPVDILVVQEHYLYIGEKIINGEKRPKCLHSKLIPQSISGGYQLKSCAWILKSWIFVDFTMDFTKISLDFSPHLCCMYDCSCTILLYLPW